MVTLSMQMLSGGISPIEDQPPWLQIITFIPQDITLNSHKRDSVPRCRNRYPMARVRLHRPPWYYQRVIQLEFIQSINRCLLMNFAL